MIYFLAPVPTEVGVCFERLCLHSSHMYNFFPASFSVIHIILEVLEDECHLETREINCQMKGKENQVVEELSIKTNLLRTEKKWKKM